MILSVSSNKSLVRAYRYRLSCAYCWAGAGAVDELAADELAAAAATSLAWTVGRNFLL